MAVRTQCYYCAAPTDLDTGRCGVCGSLPPSRRRRPPVLSAATGLALALLLAGANLAYLLLGGWEQQVRARGALCGCAVVAAVGIGLMLVWPWPRSGRLAPRWRAIGRREFGRRRGAS